MVKFNKNSVDDINKNDLFYLTSKLISLKSISPRQSGCIDFIESFLKNLRFTTTRLDRNATSNLFALWEQDACGIETSLLTKPIVAFAGHVDVVPAGDLKKWISDPFLLTERDGMLYGRGISDMKGAIVAFLYATQKYIEYVTSSDNINTSKIKIAFAITSDEEGDAKDGTAVIVEYLKQNNITLDYCIVGEPSCVENLGDVIKVGRRGSLTGHLEIMGKQGHVAYPESCINPIHQFAFALNELTQISWDNGGEYFPRTSLQFTNINSGIGADNVIPNNLLARFNLRYNNNITVDAIKKKIDTVLSKFNLNYTIKWYHSASPFLAKTGILLKNLTDAIKTTCGISPKLKTDGGTSDGRFLIEVCNELLEFGLNNKSIHQINENIKTNDLLQLFKVYYIVLTKFNENKEIKL